MKNLIFDGAFGTLYAAITGKETPCELACLNDAQTVRDIHKSYIAGGAQAIKTNTFGVNSDNFPDRDMRLSIISEAFALASGNGAEVFADIGPVENKDEYLWLVQAFAAAGARNFLFETLSSAEGLDDALKYIKSMGGYSIVSFAVSRDGYSNEGVYYTELLKSADADCVGLNCMCGPTHMLALIKKLGGFYKPLSAMPNAGYPANIGGRTVYIDNPEYFSLRAAELAECGVYAIGGCCGTTPEHIKALAARVKGIKPTAAAPTAQIITHKNTAPEGSGGLIAAELSMPENGDGDFLIKSARLFREAGCDYVTLPDSPLGRSHADSLALAALVEKEAGITAIPHICCRDRNRIAVKGGLLAASIQGVHSVLAITGDPLPDSERGAVFSLNSYTLISFINDLNREALKQPFTVYAALNTSAAVFETELHRAQKKKQCGAVRFFTQPLFSGTNIENLSKARVLGCRIFAGLMPLAGYKNALFLNNEVPGMEIPDRLLDRLQAQPDNAVQVCMSFAKSMADAAMEYTDSFYIMTPLKKTALSCELIAYIKDKKSHMKGNQNAADR